MKHLNIHLKKQIDRFRAKRVGKTISSIFSVDWYLFRYPDVRAMVEKNKTTALRHYVWHGAKEGRSPNIFFDVDFYIGQNIEILQKFHDDRHGAVLDYITNNDRKLLATHPLFDANWYISNNKDVQKAFDAGVTYPLKHFLDFGAREGRDPHPMFDTKWYLNNYPDARSAALAGSTTAIEHYLQLGAKRGYSPSPSFNSRWYLDKNRDVAILVAQGITDAASHYLSLGRKERRPIRSHLGATSDTFSGPSPARSWCNQRPSPRKEIALLYQLSEAPLVSIIIVNRDGSSHLKDLFFSLENQTYQNYEIIFVDNNSSDHSRELAKELYPDCRIVSLNDNLGFAEANNIGLRHAHGELLALLNNDTKVDPDWLYALVNTMKSNSTAGAIAPKIRFWTKFSSLEIVSAESFSLDLPHLRSSLIYKKFFIDYGAVTGENLRAVKQGDQHIVSLKIPIQKTPFELRILGEKGRQSAHLHANGANLKVTLDSSWTVHTYTWSPLSLRSGKFVINNAGSTEDASNNTSDRGFGAYDEGQFDQTEEISSVCGCSLLIRRDALQGMDLFIGDLVAYFEDSELSRRMTNDGFDLIYCPLSVVYHKHSATSEEKSVFWMTYVTRNRILYKYLALDTTKREQFFDEQMKVLIHQKAFFSDVKNIVSSEDRNYARALPKIIDDLPALVKKISAGKNVTKSSLRIGVYNNYWRTLGGGEAHALNIISVLSKISTVEMISIDDFDVEGLLAYFGVRSLNVRKRIVNDMTPGLTGEYDVFINSTYMSECPSLAKMSFYIVSFPSKTPTAEFLRSYKFLPNGEFSLEWMEKIWGVDRFDAKVLYPAVSNKIYQSPSIGHRHKEKIILSVGRFFSDGHCKNQHIIAEIFKKFANTYEGRNWKLLLIGSSNEDNYVEDVIASLSGFNAEVRTDASIEFLSDSYRRASIYVHAAGYGHDVDVEPENFEHFGMTIVEAAMNGCFPIVYGQAGPKEIVTKLKLGKFFYTIEEAVQCLVSQENILQDAGMAESLSNTVSNAAGLHFQVAQSESNLREIGLAINLERLTDRY